MRHTYDYAASGVVVSLAGFRYIQAPFMPCGVMHDSVTAIP
jgi:hypothetical protein